MHRIALIALTSITLSLTACGEDNERFRHLEDEESTTVEEAEEELPIARIPDEWSDIDNEPEFVDEAPEVPAEEPEVIIDPDDSNCDGAFEHTDFPYTEGPVLTSAHLETELLTPLLNELEDDMDPIYTVRLTARCGPIRLEFIQSGIHPVTDTPSDEEMFENGITVALEDGVGGGLIGEGYMMDPSITPLPEHNALYFAWSANGWFDGEGAISALEIPAETSVILRYRLISDTYPQIFDLIYLYMRWLDVDTDQHVTKSYLYEEFVRYEQN